MALYNVGLLGEDEETNLLTRTLVQRKVLGNLSSLYLNNEDGSLKEDGLRISFLAPCAEEANDSYVNVMCMRWTPYKKVYGISVYDNQNIFINHNCDKLLDTEIELGVNLDGISKTFQNFPIQKPVVWPIDKGDKKTVLSLLYDAHFLTIHRRKDLSGILSVTSAILFL